MVTVGQLIDELSQYDDDAQVLVWVPDGEGHPLVKSYTRDDFAVATSEGRVLLDLDGTWEEPE